MIDAAQVIADDGEDIIAEAANPDGESVESIETDLDLDVTPEQVSAKLQRVPAEERKALTSFNMDDAKRPYCILDAKTGKVSFYF